jgi:hypothetical protein
MGNYTSVNIVQAYLVVFVVGITTVYHIYRIIPSVLDPRKCEYLKEYSLDFE